MMGKQPHNETKLVKCDRIVQGVISPEGVLFVEPS